jgi:hypothetical protein
MVVLQRSSDRDDESVSGYSDDHIGNFADHRGDYLGNISDDRGDIGSIASHSDSLESLRFPSDMERRPINQIGLT